MKLEDNLIIDSGTWRMLEGERNNMIQGIFVFFNVPSCLGQRHPSKCN